MTSSRGSASTGNAGIVVVGSLNADLMVYCDRLPKPGETVQGNGFAIGAGGKSANQAVAAGRLGAKVALVGAVGDDANGALLLTSVAESGVDVSRVRRHPTEPTGVALISVDATAENSIVIAPGANGTLSPDDVDDAAFAQAAVVCLCLEIPLPTVIAAAAAGRAAGALVVLNPSPFGPLSTELTELVDVLLVNTHEASLYLDGRSMPTAADAVAGWEAVRESFRDRGLHRVVVTLGAAGSVVLDSTVDDKVAVVPPTRVDAIDTTGAGDAFTGALAHRIAAGDELLNAARFASVAAALATTGRGTQASYPTAAAIGRHLDVAPPP